MPANPETCTGCLHWRDYRGLSNAPEPPCFCEKARKAEGC